MSFIKKEITKKSLDYQRIKSFLEENFPEEQRMPMPVLNFLCKFKQCNLTGYYEDDLFIGVFFHIEFPHTVYLFYFAVNEQIQNKGYGTRMLEDLKQQFSGKSISTLIETMDESAENYPQRVKRLAFYERNGFHTTGISVGRGVPTGDFISTNPQFSVEDAKKIIKWGGLTIFPREKN